MRHWLNVLAIMFAPVAAEADQAALEAEIQRLRAEVSQLQGRLALYEEVGSCAPGGEGSAHLPDLLAKLERQAEAHARDLVGLGSGPRHLPDSLLSSVVPGQFIVLSQDTDGVITRAGLLPQQILYRYGPAFDGFAAQMTPAQQLAVLADPAVRDVVANGRVFASQVSPTAPTGTEDSALALTQTDPADAPVDVFLFDTGIRATHAALLGRVSASGFSSFNNGIATEDCSGHGTFVAARVAGQQVGQTNAAQLISVKVMDAFGAGDVATVISGIDWVLQQLGSRPAVVNMSLSRMADSASVPLDLAVNRLIDAGAIVVVAAGNSGQLAQDVSPARVPRAVTVGAVDGKGELTQFSNAGQGVDIYAPGADVASASIRDICGWEAKSGTSFSAPLVAGMIADLLAQGRAPETVLRQIQRRASRVATGAFTGETHRLILPASDIPPPVFCIPASQPD